MTEQRLAYRVPYDFAALLAFFARRAIAGVEYVDAESYRRAFVFNGKTAALDLDLAGDNALRLRVGCADAAAAAEAAIRIRRMFDVDADIAAINTRLGCKPPLRRLVAKHPGQRVPGGWDGFEIAVRAVLGQQVSVAAARTLAARLVQRFGMSVAMTGGSVNLFPAAAALADADLAVIGLTRARAASLRALAQAVCFGTVNFEVDQPLEEFVASCVALPGIGPWTAHYIAMRALRHADAFPAADLVLRKAVSRDDTLVPVKVLTEMAENWRPYRAYAVLHLWRSQG